MCERDVINVGGVSMERGIITVESSVGGVGAVWRGGHQCG